MQKSNEIVETQAEYCGKTQTVYRTPCGETIPKQKIEYDWTHKNEKDEPTQTERTLTPQDVQETHTKKCKLCAIITGKSKQKKGLTQQQIADLFALRLYGFESGTGNFSSAQPDTTKQGAILHHYSETEAIRTNSGKIIDNMQCWSRGFAICPRVKSDHRLHLRTLRQLDIHTNQQLEIEVLEENVIENDVLFRVPCDTGEMRMFRYFLDASDPQDTRNSFVAELCEPCMNIKEAFESMQPKSVKNALTNGYELATVQKCETCTQWKEAEDDTYLQDKNEKYMECKNEHSRKTSTCGYTPKTPQPNERTIKRQGELFFIPISTALQPTPPKPETIQKRTKETITVSYGQCKYCDAKTRECDDETDWRLKSHPYDYGYFGRKPKKCEHQYDENVMTIKSRQKTRFTPYPQIAETTHTATEITQINGINGNTYARGTVRHENGEHQRLTLGPLWHLVAHNTPKVALSTNTDNRD